ncbi:hypothetical protein [Kribbella sp. NPDC051718]|uniref:hypothetical protein n=1 Tax=Kribbella sp. NPDC051718 TaxID=3155168 RepID=UPI00344AF0C5
MTLPARLRTHTIQVEPYQGTGARGPVFGTAVPVTCRVEEKVQLVRSDTGEEAVSSSMVFCDLDVVIPVESRVTVNGRVTSVLTVATFDTAGRSRLEHKEVFLA